METILLNKFKSVLNLKLRAKGYTTAQRERIIAKLGDGTIVNWIRKYGPLILGIIMKLLPLILLLEEPKGVEEPKIGKWIDDEFKEAERLRKPFDEEEAWTVLNEGGISLPEAKKKKKQKDGDKSPPPKPRR
jgi:hypothetical protein